MAKALLPFYALYIGDGSTTAFTLDVSKDPFYIANDLTGIGSPNLIPTATTLSEQFDQKTAISALQKAQAHKAANDSDYGISSTSIDGYVLTFNLSSTPASGDLVAVQGYLEF